MGEQLPVFFNRGVGWPRGASVDDVAEVVVDVDSAPVADDGQRVVQGGGLGSGMGADREPSACQ